MKYAILGDIHSNLEALGAVLADSGERGADRYVCVGDIVGYNADPCACLDRVRELEAPTVKGNHDHYCSCDSELTGFHPLAAEVVHWTRKQLGEERIEWLRSLSYKKRVDSFTIVHSTLDMPEKWGYVFDKYEADANFTYQRTSVCFFGHTHVPLAFERNGDVRQGTYSKIKVQMGKKYFVNVGSVGQPRDGDPRAAYAIYDSEAHTISLHRIEYDIAAAQKKVRAAGLPERLAQRLETGH
jgi:diadenosine tetraphosphatase ApaH/serine/threonine PP2A family protein phosphatase